MGAATRVFFGDPASAGYKAFRAGMAEYVALLPPNSHGEANPADKDPVPLPFDSTYLTSSPEHDAFVVDDCGQWNWSISPTKCWTTPSGCD